MNIEQIKEIIPHRYPFLLVDKVISVEEGKSCVAKKNVTINEPFFQGHFPNKPLMPGVLIVEALAQTGAIALMSKEENKDKLAVFAGIEKVRFKKQVLPGDTLKMEVSLGKFKRGIGKGKAVAYVDGKVACKGKLKFALTDTE